MRVLLLGCAALSLVPGGAANGQIFAAAQTRAPQAGATQDDSSTEIVVSTERQKYVRDLQLVRQISLQHEGQLARFYADVCPLVLGGPVASTAAIQQRLRDTAAKVGVKSGRPGCQPNLTVMIVDNGPELISKLKSQRPVLFSSISVSERARVDAAHGPVWNWYAVAMKDKNGGSVDRVSNLSSNDIRPPPADPADMDSQPMQALPDGASVTHSFSVSRLSSPVRADIEQSFVVLDAHAVAGLSPRQIGDFAAFIGLSTIDYSRVNAFHRNSILRLLQNKALGLQGPDEITEFDLVYLQTLYSGTAAGPFDRGTARIAGRLRSGVKSSD